MTQATQCLLPGGALQLRSLGSRSHVPSHARLGLVLTTPMDLGEESPAADPEQGPPRVEPAHPVPIPSGQGRAANGTSPRSCGFDSGCRPQVGTGGGKITGADARGRPGNACAISSKETPGLTLCPSQTKGSTPAPGRYFWGTQQDGLWGFPQLRDDSVRLQPLPQAQGGRHAEESGHDTTSLPLWGCLNTTHP